MICTRPAPTVCGLVAAMIGLSGCNDAKAQTSAWSRALLIFPQQERLLRSMPPAGPNSAEEPTLLDLHTGAEITAIYWAPSFVLSIAFAAHGFQVPFAVVTRTRSINEKNSPLTRFWIPPRSCPPLPAALRSLQAMLNRPVQVPGTKPYKSPHYIQQDGGGYTVRVDEIAGMEPGMGSTEVLSGTEGTPVGLWTSETMDALKPCLKAF